MFLPFPSAISEDEKVVVRAALLQCIEDPVPQVGGCHWSSVTSRVFPFTCPVGLHTVVRPDR